MTNGDESAERSADVLIAGAGLAGLTAAFGFAQAGFDVVSSGPAERTGRGRTVALLDQSVAFLKSLGLWSSLQPQAAPLRALRLIDDTGALFPPRPVEFHAAKSLRARWRSSLGNADKVTGKGSCPRHGTDRIIDRLEYWSDPPGDASADLVECAHRTKQHTVVYAGRKTGGTNFAVELNRRHKFAMRPRGAARLKHPLDRIVKKKTVQRVSIHHGQKHCTARP